MTCKITLWVYVHPSYSPLLFIRWGASQVQFFAMSQFDWPITKKNGGSPKWKVLFSGTEFLPFGPPIQVKGGQHLHKGKKWYAIGNSLRNMSVTWELLLWPAKNRGKQKTEACIESRLSNVQVESEQCTQSTLHTKHNWKQNPPPLTRKEGRPLHMKFHHNFIHKPTTDARNVKPYLLIRWAASQVLFLLQRANLIGPSLKKNELRRLPK